MADVENMAPRDGEWHVLYARNSSLITQLLEEVRDHPAFSDSQDLGDWVETLLTLNSFRPRTHPEFEDQALKEVTP